MIKYFFIIAILLLTLLFVVVKKDLQYWLPSYLWQLCTRFTAKRSTGQIHIILCKVDHFEPGNGGVSIAQQEERVQHWFNEYPRMAKRHSDADGCFPKHTWFYPPHHDLKFLKELVQLCSWGFGEVEMHLHHNRMPPFPDTEETLRKKIEDCIQKYSRYGIFCTEDNRKCFAFIHGDWSLDNAGGEKICGINNEISILKDMGCFADFTFPSLGKAQPMRINSIFYAKDNVTKPKSYNWGKKLIVGKVVSDGLLLIQGIIGFRWRSRQHKFKPSIEASNLDAADFPFSARVDYWVKNAVTIPGRPEWRFVKLHTHGAREEAWDSLTGEKADSMFRYLEIYYNDQKKYFLHYVTAREMYNIVKAAEAGMRGNPNNYRNFEIPKYQYLSNDIFFLNDENPNSNKSLS